MMHSTLLRQKPQPRLSWKERVGKHRPAVEVNACSRKALLALSDYQASLLIRAYIGHRPEHPHIRVIEPLGG